MVSKDYIVPLILCGGSGSRLWPASRKSFPKQFLSFCSKGNNSLLQDTVERILELKNIESPILICNEEHRFIVAEQMRNININPKSILLEPFAKNTGPAIILSALKSLEDGKDPILVVLSSDHKINNNSKFITALNEGIKNAKQEKLVTFGVIPQYPETGYGYIKSHTCLNNKEIKGHKILEFVEKPNLKNAKKFLADSRYSWNSGIFIFKASKILNEIKKYKPEVYYQCKESLINNIKDNDFIRINKDSFEKCPNISIDNAVMEKTEDGIIIPLDVGWSDIGHWKAIWENSQKDKNGNVSKGKTLIQDSKNCYFRSENRLIVGTGLKDLIVVETNDAILISNINKTQEIKNIVHKLNTDYKDEATKHKKIFRPWGHYISIIEDITWQVKLLNIKVKEKISLQLHNHRSEHWIVIKGIAKVEIDENILILKENQSTYIPMGAKHRLTNLGDSPLILIEVQSGSYIGEDDIIRFVDKYGRAELN